MAQTSSLTIRTGKALLVDQRVNLLQAEACRREAWRRAELY
jgi:hypothetical protein